MSNNTFLNFMNFMPEAQGEAFMRNVATTTTATTKNNLKTISFVLEIAPYHKTIDDFLNLAEVFDCDYILAGGAVRELFNKTKEGVVDYDLFFKTKEEASFMEEVLIRENKFKEVFRCPEGKLLTLKNEKLGMKVQLVTENYYASVVDLLDVFDITAGQFALEDGMITTTIKALEDNYKQQVNLHRVTFPSATFKRLMKYRDKGFIVTNECITKFVTGIHELGLAGKTIDGRFYID